MKTRHAGTARDGFTLVEILIAVSILAIALVGLFSALVTGMRLRQFNEEKTRARNGAEQMLSAVRGMSGIPEAYGRFGGGGDGETFAIYGLPNPSATEPAGRIIIWRNKSALKNRTNPPQPDSASPLTLTQDEILEAQAAFSQSFPTLLDTTAEAAGTGWTDYIDTNGDGTVDSADRPQLMPVTVRIRWRSRHGIVTQYYATVVGRR